MSQTRHSAAQTSTSSSRVSTFPQLSNASASHLSGTLRLRAEDDNPIDNDDGSTRHIRWSEDVIDNEGMGKKSSKVCCIYHKTRPVGESSSESESPDSSSSESDSDSESNPGSRRRYQNRHDSNQGDSHERAKPSPERRREAYCSNRKNRKMRRKPSPNAYEKMPKSSREG